MSQEKVNRYKEEKANRKKTMKKEKLKHNLSVACASVICVAAIGWIGYSAYGYFRSGDDTKVTQTEVDLNALNDYMNSVTAENTDSTDDSAEE